MSRTAQATRKYSCTSRNSRPRATSVGSAAILRFARPVSYQDFPDQALPEELRDANPRGIWRLVDGSLARDTP